MDLPHPQDVALQPVVSVPWSAGRLKERDVLPDQAQVIASALPSGVAIQISHNQKKENTKITAPTLIKPSTDKERTFVTMIVLHDDGNNVFMTRDTSTSMESVRGRQTGVQECICLSQWGTSLEELQIRIL